MPAISNLIFTRDLLEKYPKNDKGEYDPEGKRHPDAVAANSITRTALELLAEEVELYKLTSPKNEHLRLVNFLNSHKLIEKRETGD